ncbi:hypothetical protein CLIB1444_08S04412 [[Candida] jaroonii]|uniref:Uncharacterized protein n=1 Tax=[Candida] jaroonii TaxID=467808 RepID=A0ACA9YBG7_9ASCO|nr:hypothetical protein CLIB1444_08S04412 [[Candida] jaroonii]
MAGEFTTTQSAKYIANSKVKSSVFDRPGTALHRVVEKVVGFTGLFPASPNKDLDDEEYVTVSERSGGFEISKKIIPIIKKLQVRTGEKASVEDNLEFSFKKWGTKVSYEFNQRLLEEFGNMFAFQSKSSSLINARLEDLFHNLNLLQEKEKQISKLVKTIVSQRETVTKVIASSGPMSSTSEAEREKLEVHIWNESIYVRQYERAISGGLKESIYDCLQTLQSIGISLENESRTSLEMLKKLELEFLEQSPQKLRDSPLDVVKNEDSKKKSKVDIIKDFEMKNENIPRRKHRHFPGTPCPECDSQHKHPYDVSQATRIVPDLNLGDYQPNESWY